jgi:hypothetical protein
MIGIGGANCSADTKGNTKAFRVTAASVDYAGAAVTDGVGTVDPPSSPAFLSGSVEVYTVMKSVINLTSCSIVSPHLTGQ